jgi:hypothetical protein
MQDPEILHMGLSPMVTGHWIEPDTAAREFYLHKQRQRRRLGEHVYRVLPESEPAQRELANLLAQHLLRDHPGVYRRSGALLHCVQAGVSLPLEDSETLWNSSLWVADDLVVMQAHDGDYRMTAASLCSPSHWRLEDKFGLPLGRIHAVIPDFNARLKPGVDRFLAHLRVDRPVVRYNWGLQLGDALCQRPGEDDPATDETLYYRVERQSLRRLPASAAIVFTIRVYLHPLAALLPVPGALAQLLAAVDACSPAIYQYKDFARVEPALEPWRRLLAHSGSPQGGR